MRRKESPCTLKCLSSTARRFTFARCGTCSIRCCARWNGEQSSRRLRRPHLFSGAVPEPSAQVACKAFPLCPAVWKKDGNQGSSAKNILRGSI